MTRIPTRPAPPPPSTLPAQATPLTWQLGALIAAVAGLAAPVAQAQTFGSLGNFDVVNNTGHTAYGFEIEIEDARYDHAGTISSIFGYDRVFGFVSPDPGAVVRYGRPTVEYIAGFGARITYGGSVGADFTPSAPFTTYGESCWPGANANWRATSCDHFGVSTYGSPAKVTQSWILDMGGGTLAKQVVGVPAVLINYTPPPPPPPVGPPPPPPPPPVIVMEAPDLGLGPQANAFWVRVTKTSLEDNVDLGDLLIGNHPGARPEIAGMAGLVETESEWQPLQIGVVDEVSKVVDAPSPAVVYRFEFFNYDGRFDDDGAVDPIGDQFPQQAADGRAFIVVDGETRYLSYVGQQIAGFNAVQLAPVPEPSTLALWAGGLAGLLGWSRRRARQRG